MRSSKFVLAIAIGVPSLAEAQPPVGAPVLRVQSSAEVRVAPDLAVVRIGVAEEARTVHEAQSAVNIAAGGILDAMRGLGLEERHVQTVRLMLSPVYSQRRQDDPEEPRIVGYRASTSVSVRVEDLDLVGHVIDAALNAGANQLEGVSFALQDDQEMRQEVLRRAIADVRGIADAMAEALGVSLEAIISVTEGNVAVRRPVMNTSRMTTLHAEAPTSVSSGEVSVSASVSMNYQISERADRYGSNMLSN